MSLTPLASIRGAAPAPIRGMEALNPILADLRAVLDANAENPSDMAHAIYEAQAPPPIIISPWIRRPRSMSCNGSGANWRSEPFAYLDLLTAILVNTVSDDADLLLEEKLAQETDPRCKNTPQVRLEDRTDHMKQPEEAEEE